MQLSRMKNVSSGCRHNKKTSAPVGLELFPSACRMRIIDRGAGRIYRAMFTSLSVTRLISVRQCAEGCGTVIASLKGAGAIHQSKGAGMKQRNILSWVFTLALAIGLVSFSQAFGAQSQRQYPNQERQQQPNAQQQNPAPSNRIRNNPTPSNRIGESPNLHRKNCENKNG